MDVRPGTADDLEQIDSLYNHYVRTSPVTFHLEPLAPGERKEWFAGFSASGRHRLLVAVDGTTVLGYACSFRHRPKRAYETSVETSVYVRDGAAGRGVGTSLYQQLFEALAGEDVHRAVAGVTLPNAPSVALHERFRFRHVGTFTEQGRKFGRYWDVAWYEKPLR